MSLSLRKAINTFLTLHSMTPTRFGRLALNDPRLVKDLRNGRQMSKSTEAKVMDFINTYLE